MMWQMHARAKMPKNKNKASFIIELKEGPKSILLKEIALKNKQILKKINKNSPTENVNFQICDYHFISSFINISIGNLCS